MLKMYIMSNTVFVKYNIFSEIIHSLLHSENVGFTENSESKIVFLSTTEVSLEVLYYTFLSDVKYW